MEYLKQIPFLFEAKVNYQSLPIVNQIPKRISEVIEILENISSEFSVDEKTIIHDKEYIFSKIENEFISNFK